MPYKDPERQKAAKRESAMRRRREVSGDEMRRGAAEAELPTVLPDPPDVDELIRLLGVQARLGSVQAAKLLLDRIEKENRDGDSDRKDSLSGIDELAARRSA